MASCNVNVIDLSNLETELRLAIEEDEKYKREDAAKFRAIEQSRTYEEFRNIVKASHLKPLDKHESLYSKNLKPPSWNSCANAQRKYPGDVLVTSSISRATHEDDTFDEMLKNELGYHNFHRLWLILSEDRERRMKLLKKAFSQGNVFEDHDLPVDLIAGILETLYDSISQSHQVPEETFDLSIGVMKSICSTPRFSLHMLFLSEKERSIINQLKEKLKLHSGSKEKQEASGGDVNSPLAFLDNF